MDKSSGRDSSNSGSDSAKHHKGTAHAQYKSTANVVPAVPTTAPSAQTVRDLKPFPVPGSAAR
ncbi:hypothetical protein AWB69_05978 [Caballeronia udeis]|uniref:Uncharacterized protein n=1 Tax=Caballeronia udeis TaxID=1232866 RepID=A0A158IG83_9BURK|nr:hypothetical protein [Caballeronia udeis]SAL55642.1 hypothetical protein AWB69_05978 [Caballeronia udeis]